MIRIRHECTGECSWCIDPIVPYSQTSPLHLLSNPYPFLQPLKTPNSVSQDPSPCHLSSPLATSHPPRIFLPDRYLAPSNFNDRNWRADGKFGRQRLSGGGEVRRGLGARGGRRSSGGPFRARQFSLLFGRWWPGF